MKPAPSFIMAVFIIFTILLLLGCNSVGTPYSENAFAVEGRLSGIAEPFELKSRTGKVYKVVDLPSQFQQDGLHIKATARHRKDTSNHSLELSEIRPVSKLVADWDRLIESKDRDLVDRVDDFRRAAGLPLPFWPRENADLDDNIVSFAWSGCGELYVSFVKEIPKRGKDNLEPDMAFEVDAKGNILRQWSLPGNGSVRGVRADELLVAYDAKPIVYAWKDNDNVGVGGLLAISSGGGYRFLQDDQNLSDQTRMDCPEIPQFAGSAFTQCSIFKDRMSGDLRRLVYQGPCT